jgi:hypothetical protein
MKTRPWLSKLSSKEDVDRVFPIAHSYASPLPCVLNAKPELCNGRFPGLSIWVRRPRLQLEFPRFVGRKPLLFHFLHVGAAELPVFAAQIVVFDLHPSLSGRGGRWFFSKADEPEEAKPFTRHYRQKSGLRPTIHEPQCRQKYRR